MMAIREPITPPPDASRIRAVREEIAYYAGTIGLSWEMVPLAQQQAENALRAGESGYRAVEIGKSACATLAGYDRQ